MMRTNNLAENTNMTTAKLLGKHSQFYAFVMGIQRISALTYCRWVQLQKKLEISKY